MDGTTKKCLQVNACKVRKGNNRGGLQCKVRTPGRFAFNSRSAYISLF